MFRCTFEVQILNFKHTHHLYQPRAYPIYNHIQCGSDEANLEIIMASLTHNIVQVEKIIKLSK